MGFLCQGVTQELKILYTSKHRSWRICQLRCPALCKDLSESENKEWYIPHTSEPWIVTCDGKSVLSVTGVSENVVLQRFWGWL